MIIATNSTFTIENSNFINTTSIKDSSFSFKNSSIKISNSIFNGTHSRSRGSVVSFYNCSSQITNSTFAEGKSRSKSAAINSINTELNISESDFIQNIALSEMSVYSEFSKASIENCHFTGKINDEISVPLMNQCRNCTFDVKTEEFVVIEEYPYEELFTTLLILIFTIFVLRNKISRLVHSFKFKKL
ncbi:hypothetical protein TVAG_451060 [Trichomonas vaginalis G3]|uniref:Uncharacterized protein n=1 Tax=Trichomonas vaginalis (strain ATCC PRA-98 / G3) TaxID=412133 RepID=A2EYQ9_TRIV3|nr:hypothetical protein TVAGG3_0866080 [Trichomonas vaginalis G3]EAY02206.1 hypothetical protein TVAG_451060 [Trichomonas vaginalis G3]KAI5501035.1 hypothetical protein TVAGG3_0866080 [Trichomonas vaginalis G3]|eukprot:XP_001314544.1 hypothetical protein [Trichomonas vaginalis G3]